MAKYWGNDLRQYVQAAKRGIAEAKTSYILAVGQSIQPAKQVFNEVNDIPGVDESYEINYQLDSDSNFGGEKDAYCGVFERDPKI